MTRIDVTYRVNGIKHGLEFGYNSLDYIDIRHTINGTASYEYGYRVTLTVSSRTTKEIVKHLTKQQAEEIGTALLYYAREAEQ